LVFFRPCHFHGKKNLFGETLLEELLNHIFVVSCRLRFHDLFGSIFIEYFSELAILSRVELVKTCAITGLFSLSSVGISGGIPQVALETQHLSRRLGVFIISEV
jgi:hypothetical protein